MAGERTAAESVFTDLMNLKFVQKDLSQMPVPKGHTLSDYFVLYTTKDKKSAIKIYCELWSRVIIMKEGPKKPPIGFMDVGYSRLKISLIKDEKKIRLIKNKKYEELWCEDDDTLQRWYNELADSCVYSNFKNDYDLHTMLGKGNFAKVYLVQGRACQKYFSAKIFDKQLIKNDEFEKVN